MKKTSPFASNLTLSLIKNTLPSNTFNRNAMRFLIQMSSVAVKTRNLKKGEVMKKFHKLKDS